jgi:hypothetical protein
MALSCITLDAGRQDDDVRPRYKIRDQGDLVLVFLVGFHP